MTSRDFCFWLQGYLEISGSLTINQTDLKVVRDHLNLVFKHEIDPSMGNQEHQNALNDIHKPNPFIKYNLDNPDQKMRC